VREAATQDKAACPEQTKANEKHDKLFCFAKNLRQRLCFMRLKKINHRIKLKRWFGVSFCIGFTFAKTALPCGGVCAGYFLFFGSL
jgi:hypothetical protein